MNSNSKSYTMYSDILYLHPENILVKQRYPIENSKFNEMLYVSDVIRRNSRYSADDESCENYWDIIHDKEITAEE